MKRSPLLVILVSIGCRASVSPIADVIQAHARDLPSPPPTFERVDARRSDDWRQLEGWQLDGVRIETFDRINDPDGTESTWAELSTSTEVVDVACRRAPWPPPSGSVEALAAVPMAAVTVCFIDEALLVLVGRPPWADRVGLWLTKDGPLHVWARLQLTSNLGAFNPEQLTVYRPSEARPLAYIDHRGMHVDPSVSPDLRRRLTIVAAVHQIHLPSPNSERTSGPVKVDRALFSRLDVMLEGIEAPPVGVDDAAPPLPTSEALTRVGWGAIAERLPATRQALDTAHAEFEDAAADRTVRGIGGIRFLLASGRWDMWAPDGNDAPAIMSGLDLFGGILLFQRLQLTVGIGFIGNATDDSDAPVIAPDSTGGGFAAGLTSDLTLRLGEWDDLDVLYVGASGRWLPFAQFKYSEVAERAFDMAAVGPTAGFEACAASEARTHLCLFGELSAMATWIYGEAVSALGEGIVDQQAVEALRAATRTDQGWSFELRLGVRFGY